MSNRSDCPACGSSTALGEVHCFKCGYINTLYRMTPGFFGDQETRSQVIKLRDDIILRPAQFTPAALMWLYQACIYDPIIVSQKIAYCKDINKVLIPAFSEKDELMFYQLRKLDSEKDGDKYISYGKMSSYTINYNDHDENLLLIVEDHLSAIRLRKHFNVCALSGTSINWATCLQIVKRYTNIVFWLDPDQPGREAMYKLFSKLKYHSNKHATKLMFMGSLIGTVNHDYDFRRINPNTVIKDPKFYLDHEIKNIVKQEVIPL